MKSREGEYLIQIEEYLEKQMPDTAAPQGQVANAMKYSLLGGGKRVRGILTLAFYELFSPQTTPAPALPFAAAVEMIHSYSLIHDDLPCMDDDILRRGKPSCHIAFGESTALLAGDALLTLAFQTMAKPGLSGVTAQQQRDCIFTLASKAGTAGMIGGQVLDLENESQTISGERMEQTDRMKTGALITAAALMGSIVGGASKEEQALVADFAGNIGLAFQIIDDILDATSTEEKLGKPIGSDADNEKNTYVSVYGIDTARKMAADLTDKAQNSLAKLGKEAVFLEAYVQHLVNRDF